MQRVSSRCFLPSACTALSLISFSLRRTWVVAILLLAIDSCFLTSSSSLLTSSSYVWRIRIKRHQLADVTSMIHEIHNDQKEYFHSWFSWRRAVLNVTMSSIMIHFLYSNGWFKHVHTVPLFLMLNLPHLLFSLFTI